MIITEEIRQTVGRRLHDLMEEVTAVEGIPPTSWDELTDEEKGEVFAIVDAVHSVSLPLIVAEFYSQLQAEFCSQLQAELDRMNKAEQVETPPEVDEFLDDPSTGMSRLRPVTDAKVPVLEDPWMER